MKEIIYYLTLNAYHEARGEPDEGVRLVTATVLNRARRRRKTIKEVIFQRHQYSWTNDSIPNYEIREPEAYKRCRRLVIETIVNYLNGNLYSDVDHYFNHNQVLPSWAGKMKPFVKIGNHSFFIS